MNEFGKLVRLDVEREPLAVMVANLDGTIEFMNLALRRWTGADPARFGDVWSLMEHFVPDPTEQESHRKWWCEKGLPKAEMGLDPDPLAIRLTTPEGPRFVVVYTAVSDSKAVITFVDETPSWHAARLLEVQRDLSSLLLHCTSIRSCLLTLLESMVCLPGLDGGMACQLDEESGALQVIGSRGMSDVFSGTGTWLGADSWAACQVKSGQPVYARASEIPGELGDLVTAAHLKHLALVPVTDGQTVVGCMLVSSHRFERIGEPSRNGLESLAFRGGEAIDLIRAREARRTAERQFRLAVESASLGMWMADLESGMVQSCPRTRELHGHMQDEPLTMESTILAVHPDDRDGLRAGVGQAIANGGVYSGQYRTSHGGNDCRWISINAHAFQEDGGKRFYGIVRDITASKQAEAALMEARDNLELRVQERTAELEAARQVIQKESKLLQVALDSSQAGAWSWEIGHQMVDCDVRVRHLFGYGPDEPVTFDLWLSRVHPDDRKGLLDRVSEVVESNADADWSQEFRISHPDLGERWIASLGRAQRDAGGNTIRFVGINFDVTNRRSSESALRESEEKYRSLFESMVDGFVRMDMDGRIIETNRSFQEMLGFSRDELIQMTNAEITPKKWHPMETRVFKLQVLVSGHSAPYEKEIRRKNGTALPVELRMFVIRDSLGNPVSTWAIIQDISRRKEAERVIKEWNQTLEDQVALRTRELTQSGTRFRQLAESTFEGIAISEGGILLDVNPQLASMHGFQLFDMIGRPYSDFVASGLSELTGSSELIAHGPMGENVMTREFVALRSDGSTFLAEARICTRARQGRRILLKAVRDVTAAKQAEARLSSLKNELEQAQRLALVGEVSAGIVHQIGQPLSGMGVNLQVLRKRALGCGGDNCQLVEIFEDLEADVVRLREAVNSLRALANPGSPCRKPTDLNGLIARVMNLLSREIDQLGISLHLDYGGNVPEVGLDSVQVSQVILNLVRNAIEACAESPAKRRELRIRTSHETANWVELSIRDSGPGIHPSVLNAMFAPFVTTKPDGIGMGLRLSRTIVQAHGGMIEGGNNSGGPGAFFHVVFPADRQIE